MESEKYLLENKDYKIEPVLNEENRSVVTLLTEEFKNVKLSIKTLKFGDNENPDQTLDCSIDYDIIDRAGFTDLDDNPKFNQCIGDIVMSMLVTYLDATEKGMIEDDIRPLGEVYSEESDFQ